MSSYEPHLNPYAKLGDLICSNYMAFHILVVEHSESFDSTERIWSATPYALTGANPLLHFELLDVSPGTSSDNLVTPGSPRVSMLTPSLVRTLVQRDTQCSRTPVLKPSSNSSLPFAWITGPATDPSL